MSGPTLLPYGDGAVLVELAAAADVVALRDALVRRAHPALRSVVSAARTVLVQFEPGAIAVAELQALVRSCQAVPPAAGVGPSAAAANPPAANVPVVDQPAANAPVVELVVRYDGADLDSVAELSGLTVLEVIHRHCAVDYIVQFCGFAPGFGYLTGLDPALRLPRLSTPRPAVPAGSVAIAGEYTAIYPRSSPGGWRLLGRTDAVLFDLDRSRPALLAPGTVVRFCPR